MAPERDRTERKLRKSEWLPRRAKSAEVRAEPLDIAERLDRMADHVERRKAAGKQLDSRKAGHT
jgi:hypothetical protein